MRLRSIHFTLLACTVLSAPATALDNAGFDTSLLNWSNPFSRPAEWDPLDAMGNPNSGSARIGNPLPGNNATLLVLAQCMPRKANQSYRFGARAQLLQEAPLFVGAGIVATVHGTLNCSDEQLASYTALPFTQATVWEQSEGLVPAAAVAGSIRVWLGISKPSGVNAPIYARFDDVFLVPTPLFADDFESP